MNNDDFKKMLDLLTVASSEPPKFENPSKYHKPHTYEETILKKMADDVKTPLEEQVKSVQSIAKSADNLATESKEISKSAQICADLAYKKSKKADIKGWISIFIAAFGVLIEFATHQTQVISFLKSLLGV